MGRWHSTRNTPRPPCAPRPSTENAAPLYFFFTNKLCEPDRCFPLQIGQNWAILTDCVDFSRQVTSDKRCFPAVFSCPSLPAARQQGQTSVSFCLSLPPLFTTAAPGCGARLRPPMPGNALPPARDPLSPGDDLCCVSRRCRKLPTAETEAVCGVRALLSETSWE